MKPPKRNFNIFSLSAIDMFAAALGAFVLITIILLPNYLKFKGLSDKLKLAQAELGNCKVANGERQRKIDDIKRQTNRVQAGLAGCRQKLKTTFIAIMMKWDTRGDDVDLYLTNPKNQRFSFKKHNRARQHYPSTPSQLSVDTRRGPGVEIWETRQAVPGTYRLQYHFYRDHGSRGRTVVRTNLYHRDGMIRLRNVSLNRQGVVRTAAQIIVGRDGSVTVR